MSNIALDTNIWIYLTKPSFKELFFKLKEGREFGQIRIIVNDIILKEWDRNKQTASKSLQESIRNEYKSALGISNYLDSKKKDEYQKILLTYESEQFRIKTAEESIEEIDSFMKSCIVFETKKEQKLYIANLAIENLPPFHNKKNNFNDALIFRSICEYVRDEYDEVGDLIYVSNNIIDFTDVSTGLIYKELITGLNIQKIFSVSQLGEALKLAPELIRDLDHWIDIQLDNEAMDYLDLLRGK